MNAPPAVLCTDLSFSWPDGTPVLDHLDATFPHGRTGLVGRNGGGKSTLLRLIAGELVPTAGRVRTAGEVAWLPQHLPLQTSRTVSDLLGITARRAALQAITSGDTAPAHFTALGDDWGVEARALEALEWLGILGGDEAVLDRPVRTLSGGEVVLTAVAGLLLHRAAISLLDEPTNNLDTRARQLLYAAIDTWPGVLVVVSHDRELLERVDGIVELHDGAARSFGGPYAAYEATIAAEQETATRLVRVAAGDVAREKRDLAEAQVKLARRRHTGRRAELEKRVPKVVAHERKRQAQVSAGKLRGVHAERLDAACAALTAAESAVRDDDRIRIDPPETAVPPGRTVLQVGSLLVRGPERIGLLGVNGSGKTTLLEAIAGRRAHPRLGVKAPPVPVGYLPQRLDVLNDVRSVLDNVRAAAPHATPHDVRARLARFLVRGERVEQAAGTLSGGERFRISLACLLLAEPPPQLLLLDEPTNNLDLESVAQLVDALAGYRGALIVASHDARFLAELGVRRWWHIAGIGLPEEMALRA